MNAIEYWFQIVYWPNQRVQFHKENESYDPGLHYHVQFHSSISIAYGLGWAGLGRVCTEHYLISDSQLKKSWTPLPAKTRSENSAKTALTVSKTTLEPAMTPSTTPVVPNTFANAGHSISLTSSATPLRKSPSFSSFLFCIASLISFPNSLNSTGWLAAGSPSPADSFCWVLTDSGPDSEFAWLSSTALRSDCLLLVSVRGRLGWNWETEWLQAHGGFNRTDELTWPAFVGNRKAEVIGNCTDIRRAMFMGGQGRRRCNWRVLDFRFDRGGTGLFVCGPHHRCC